MQRKSKKRWVFFRGRWSVEVWLHPTWQTSVVGWCFVGGEVRWVSAGVGLRGIGRREDSPRLRVFLSNNNVICIIHPRIPVTEESLSVNRGAKPESTWAAPLPSYHHHHHHHHRGHRRCHQQPPFSLRWQTETYTYTESGQCIDWRRLAAAWGYAPSMAPLQRRKLTMVAFSIQAGKRVSEGDTENREKRVWRSSRYIDSVARGISASDRGSVRNGGRPSPGLQPASTAQISRKSEAMGSFGSRCSSGSSPWDLGRRGWRVTGGLGGTHRGDGGLGRSGQELLWCDNSPVHSITIPSPPPRDRQRNQHMDYTTGGREGGRGQRMQATHLFDFMKYSCVSAGVCTGAGYLLEEQAFCHVYRLYLLQLVNFKIDFKS